MGRGILRWLFGVDVSTTMLFAAASGLLLTTDLSAAGEPVQIVPFTQEMLIPPPAEVEVSRLPVFEVGAGAVVGVIAANVISGGMVTPILMGVGFGMPAEAAAVAAAPVAPAFAAMPAAAANVAAPVVAATSATMAAAHAGIVVAGGAIGAAVGNWLFGTSH